MTDPDRVGRGCENLPDLAMATKSKAQVGTKICLFVEHILFTFYIKPMHCLDICYA
jgi:hypothetical protein